MTDITKNTHAQILDDYFERGKSYDWLMERYGYSLSGIQKLVRKAKQDGRQRKEGLEQHDPRNKETKRPRTQLHGQIGIELMKYRTRNNLNYTEMGEKLGVSRFRVIDIELGCFDITLTMITRIAALVDVPLADLLNENRLNGKLKLQDES